MDRIALTDEQTTGLDKLLASWKADDNEAYGWEGPTEGPEFIAFWLDGEGAAELDEIVDSEDERAAAIRYLEQQA